VIVHKFAKSPHHVLFVFLAVYTSANSAQLFIYLLIN